ncbi:hypothetical protein RJ639_037073 [Escallonia herrerae]|uniref:Protein phosphatase 1 regulatory subunit 11 n=1 Tax=Escallonia herrerae TaxID=1293975 RepID=A0AA88WPI9_9ASTE|nr:hypothetical protein RJ639_037073 [Escallonia herrerae]
MARQARQSEPSATTATTIITIDRPSPPDASAQQPPRTLVLQLNRKKKKVTWKEGTVDNEFLQKKSSKKCCIFHKDRPFDDDDSDDECHDVDRPKKDPSGHGDGCCSNFWDEQLGSFGGGWYYGAVLVGLMKGVVMDLPEDMKVIMHQIEEPMISFCRSDD